jgi:hypothetical protein
MAKLVSRAYNEFEIKDNLTIVKRSTETRLDDEVKFYRNLPDEFKIYFPRLIDGTPWDLNDPKAFQDGKYWGEFEFYAYPNAYWVMMLPRTFDDCITLANHLNTFLESAFDYGHGSLEAFARFMYREKTISYYNDLYENFPKYRKMLDARELVINGTSYMNFNQIGYQAIEEVQKCYDGDTRESFVHGDLCFSNILFNVNRANDMSAMKLIDPRGNLGDKINLGDQYYDLAKLMHSTHGGYEYIINDDFSVYDCGDEGYELKIPQNLLLQQMFEDMIYSKYDERRIKLIQGLIFIGMVSRHYDSEKRQIAMYLNGIKILNEALDG